MLITNDILYDTPLIRKKGDITNLKNLIKNLLKENLMEFSYANGNTIFSHTVFKKNCILYTLNRFIEESQQETNINEITVLKEKIEQDEELTNKDNKLLSNILNEIYKKYYLNKNIWQNINNAQIFCDGNRNGLLCFRANSCKKDYNESLINTHQIFGHTSTNEEEIYFINDNKSMGCDTTQSKGFEGKNTHEIRTSLVHINTNSNYNCTRISVDKTINKIKQDIEIENLQDLSDSLSDSLSEISLGLELSQSSLIK